MKPSCQHEPGAVRVRHDPLQRLNERHAAQLLDVARTLGGQSDALSAHATAIDDEGISLVVETPDRFRTVHVGFAAAASGARRRLAFQDLARRAVELLESRRQEETLRDDGKTPRDLPAGTDTSGTLPGRPTFTAGPRHQVGSSHAGADENHYRSTEPLRLRRGLSTCRP
jgi:hypothetical protein